MTNVVTHENVAMFPPKARLYMANSATVGADAPLQPNTQYEVVINGTNNGTPFTRQFTFTTGTGG